MKRRKNELLNLEMIKCLISAISNTCDFLRSPINIQNYWNTICVKFVKTANLYGLCWSICICGLNHTFCYPAFNLDFFIAIYFQLLRIVVGSVGYLFKPPFANLKKLTKIEINPWNNGWILWNPQYPSFLKFNGHLPDIWAIT